MINLNTKVSLRVVKEDKTNNPTWSFMNGCFKKSEIIGIQSAGHDQFEFDWEFCDVYLSSGIVIRVLENYQELYDWFETL